KVTITKAAAKTAGDKPTIFIASDSTVQTYESNYYPQTGWGQTLYSFFGEFVEERECENCGYSQSQTYETANVIIENRAIGGRSSKSFIEEGKFDDLLEDVKPGDYVLIQWGHNDATTSRPNRYVSPADFEYWMQYYVDGVYQRGATPILVTPVARYSYTTNEDGTLKSFVGNFEKYGDVMRKMAKEQNIPIVDLTARSTALCNDFGIEGAKSLFLILAAGDYPQGAYAGGANDSTHLQYYGAYKFAQCVAEGIVDYAKEGATDELDELAKLVVNKVPASTPGVVTGLKSTTVGASSVTMTWDAEDDSELYYIYRAVLEDGQTAEDIDFSTVERYSVTPMNKYSDSACEAGVTYAYAVRGFNPKGVGEISNVIVVTTKTAGYKFDINAGDGGETEAGWIGIGTGMYNAETGYGWITYPGAGRDRGVQDNDSYSLMGRDFTLGVGEFAVDLPNGDYEITCYGGDILPGTSTQKTSYTAEGKSIGSISVKQGVASATNTVRVEDGQLNVATVGSGLVYFNGFTVTEILKAPSSLVASEKTAQGSNMTFLLGFVGVDDAAGYNVYQKSTSDESFRLVKTFTKEEYAADDLACRAMSVVLGETYEYYMTCYTADGTESARSNIETVVAVVEGVKVPSAPSNVVCVDPAAGTQGVQSTITISWDAAAVEDSNNGSVIKYVIYRSDKAEGEKGFTGFEKVGESATCTYTDTYYDLDTNISYYYKVAALNAGGLGELSAACKTPVTGTLTQKNLEKYTDRALVAVNLAGDKGAETLVSATDSEGNTLTSGVYLSWRSFEADFDADNNLTTTFDVYRDGTLIADDVKVTNLVDAGGSAASVYKVVGSNDAGIGVKAVDTKCWANQYLELSLFCPENETVPAYNDQPTECNYSANDMSLGDLDGDGELELIVKWYPSNAKDNSGYGFTGKTFLDAYDVNFATGEVELLYRIDMGVNIRSGAHYTQFQVWDFDGDGKSEIAVKTAPGTTVLRPTDGTAATLAEVEWIDCASSTLPTATISEQNDYRNSAGYVLDGPEYFTMFNGEDGSILDTVDYTPKRGSVGAWGDGYGNRVDRFLSAVAYLDGENPYAVFCRGYYTRTCLTAYYYDNESGKIKEYWAFDTNNVGSEYEAQGNHGIGVNDIDNDGKDEIIYGSLVVDHDGTLKYSTGLGHGDAMHISDWVAWNDGLEIMQVHEHDNAAYHVEIHDAETGEILMGYWTGKDTGRGVAADIDPTALGGEWWSIASPTYEGNDEPEWDSTDGEVYSTQSKLGALVKLSNVTPASNASIFWDGDLLSEVQDHTFNKSAYAPTGVVLYKWDYENEKQVPLFYSTEVYSSNGTKGNLGLIADFLGDWREEIIVRAADAVTAPESDPNKIRIYTTTIQTDYVVPCLLENLAYREGVAWENVGYNQPANLSYLLSEGLVTSQLSLGDITKNSAEVVFTEASDGVYGHDITGYEIYRAEGDGEFELIDTLDLDELVEYVPG
ncbi:MAG: GDSL-type esterase/lipase family protein, partial [Lachnospiraceae bacterium]